MKGLFSGAFALAAMLAGPAMADVTIGCTQNNCLLEGANLPISESLPATRVIANYQNPTFDIIPPITQFYVSINITHPRPGDLIIRVISPDGTVVPLSQNNGGSNAALFKDYFVWSDSFSLTLASVDADTYQLKYARPFVPFRTLAGESMNGNWILDVVDTVSQNTGTLHGFYIAFDTVDDCATSANNCGEGRVCIDLFKDVSCRVSAICSVPSCTNQNTNVGKQVQSVITFQNLTTTSLPAFFKMRVRISLQGSNGSPIPPSFITASLTSPAGDFATLANEGDDILLLYRRVNFQFPVTADVTSTGYQREPVDSYTTFVGEDPNGSWILNLASSQPGTVVIQLTSWSIELDLVNDCAPDACDIGTCIDGLFEPICDCPDSSFNTPDCRPPTSCAPGSYGSADYPRGVLNTTVFGTCTFGFVGTPIARCLSNGTLEVIQDCISADTVCPAEEYARAFFPETFVTNEAVGTCIPGWAGSPKRTCEVTGWSPNVRDNCQRVTCASVTEGNAVWPEANADPVQLVIGTCTNGFSGLPTRFCNADGTFSAIVNPCVANCPADPSYGFASWPSTAAMDTATGTCAPGYVGSPLRRCSRQGVWETNLQFHCQLARCGPVNVDNAEWPRTNPGSATYGTCNAGFFGRPFRACLANGSFGPVQNPCVSTSATCPAETAYAFADWAEANVGETVTGTCISGYSGSPRRTCLPGAWSSSVIGICTRNICPATTDAVHSFPEMKSNTRGYGTCVTGSGRPWRQCLADGTFGPIQNPCS